ncbi:MAG TPA: serine/threonine-protein kinase [Myxococcota bacterium]|nr:serine/threonine-protein kinase [Myxococcota bacterium]
MSYPRNFGPYLLLERIGAGGMSEVDLARRSVAEGSYVRFVVIKRVATKNAKDASFLRMFKDEARINSRLHHQNIAQVYDFGLNEGEFFLAMEYVPGMDLRDVQKALARRGKMIPFKVSLTIICQVLSALHYAHEARDEEGRSLRVVHRDVNPRNVMVSTSGEVKLIDFGVAMAEGRLESTQGHSLKGKFAYMAPEQIEGVHRVDKRADLFACGLMLHELAEGVHPFAGLQEVQIMHKLLAAQIPPIARSPARIDPHRLAVVHKRALARDRNHRYSEADDFRRDLEELARPLGGLCTREQMREFLERVDADGVRGIAARLSRYKSGELGLEPPPAPLPTEPELTDGTLARSGSGPVPTRRQVTVAAATGVGIGLFIALGFIVALFAVAAGAWVIWDPATKPAPVAAEVEELAPPEPSALERALEEEEEEAPAIVVPEPAAPVQRHPRTVETRAPVEPVEEPVEDPVIPDPVTPAEPIGEPGFLYVEADVEGLEVLINGIVVGTTPMAHQRVSSGRRKVVVRDPVTGTSRPYTVEIEAGLSEKLLIRWE